MGSTSRTGEQDTRGEVAAASPMQTANAPVQQPPQPKAKQQVLTNESLIKMVKAGLGEDVVVSMVQLQPGAYSITPDDLIALKSAGVSDRIIAAVLEKMNGHPKGPPDEVGRTASPLPARFPSSPSPASTTGDGAHVVTFHPNSPGMSMEFSGGKPIFTVETDGLIVSASLYDTSKAAVAEFVAVNDSKRSWHVLPESVELVLTGPRYKQINRKDPGKIIASIQRNARFQSAIDEWAASTQQQQTTVRSTTRGNVQVNDTRGNTAAGTYGSTTNTVISSPDWRARRAAAMRTVQRWNAAESDVEFISRSALRANTVHPGGQVAGLVWFNKDSALTKRGAKALLRIRIGDIEFEFPFSRTQ